MTRLRTLLLLTALGAARADVLPAQDAPPASTDAPLPADTVHAAAADTAIVAADTATVAADTATAAAGGVYDHPLYAPLGSPSLAIDEDSLADAFRRERLRRHRRAARWMDNEPFDPDSDPYFARFDPSPTRAVWFAALIPGGGQIYNRKYWKLPIIYGGFLGLLYGYQWNGRYYRTYSNAYRDLVLRTPNASYMDFLPPNYPVEARRDYLERVFKRKKNVYRNYRDYCVVGMLAVYLVSMVDAYVDASLYHFDVSPELGPDDKPALMLGYTVEF